MGTPYIGEIRMFAGNFPPVGWAFCNGAQLPISQYDALYNLIGTLYGGDGQTYFLLPNLQSRAPLHVGPGISLAQMAGAEQVTLTTQQIPPHNHTPQGNSNSGNVNKPANAVWASSSMNVFTPNAPVSNETFSAQAIDPTGQNQPHDNMLPFLAINFIIALFGIYPSPS